MLARKVFFGIKFGRISRCRAAQPCPPRSTNITQHSANTLWHRVFRKLNSTRKNDGTERRWSQLTWIVGNTVCPWLQNVAVASSAAGKWVYGEYHANHHGNKNSGIGQRGQKFRLQVHGSDQLPFPRILQRASLGRVLQVLSAPLHMVKRIVVNKTPRDGGWHTLIEMRTDVNAVPHAGLSKTA